MVKMAALIVMYIGVAIPGGAIAMGNPASAFCGQMKGHTVFAKLPDNSEIGLCYLPGDKIIDEWTLFRMLHGKVPSLRDNPFR